MPATATTGAFFLTWNASFQNVPHNKCLYLLNSMNYCIFGMQENKRRFSSATSSASNKETTELPKPFLELCWDYIWCVWANPNCSCMAGSPVKTCPAALISVAVVPIPAASQSGLHMVPGQTKSLTNRTMQETKWSKCRKQRPFLKLESDSTPPVPSAIPRSPIQSPESICHDEDPQRKQRDQATPKACAPGRLD